MFCSYNGYPAYHQHLNINQSWLSLDAWIEYFKGIAWGALNTVGYCALLTTAKGVDASFGTTILQQIATNAGQMYGYSC